MNKKHLPLALATAIAMTTNAQEQVQHKTDRGVAVRPIHVSKQNDNGGEIIAPDAKIQPDTGLTQKEEQELLGQGLVPPVKGSRLQKLPALAPSTEEERFDAELEKKYPSPKKIEKIKKAREATEKALYLPQRLKTVNKTIQLSFSNRAKIPTIYIGKNYISSWSFVDEFGNPWPIAHLSVGGKVFTEVPGSRVPDGNLTEIKNATGMGNTNATILLQGAPVRFSVDLSQKGKINYSTVDFIVKGTSPTASYQPTPAQVENVKAADSNMIAIRDGIRVKSRGFKRVNNSKDWDIYQDASNQIYIRSTYPVISPACDAILAGGGGVRVCRINYPISEIGYINESKVEYIQLQQLKIY